MTMTDPIADMLTRIRNANTASHDTVDIPASKQKAEIARILKEEGYVEDVEMISDGPHEMIRITLKYAADRAKTIHGVKRVSKPGLRVYARSNKLPKVLGGMGVAILSTSSGVMTGREAAERRLGGEVIAHIW
ncbi:MAG: 30S ribosomal protein S8 [Actinomycetota bacterium]|nr:30S ribosomal protein S8 [Actinomycetota bacterium]